MSASSRPNILWICTDQQRFDTLGCYGNTFVRTPHINRLAASGAVFDQAYTQSPVCTPSRACFLTGRYPRTTRDRQNGQNIPSDEILITRYLADQGYLCGLSGKLHLSVCNPSAGVEMEPRINDGYSVFHWSHHPEPDWAANEYNQWLAEKGLKFSTPNRADCPYVQEGMPAEYHQTTWCVEKAIDFVQDRAKDETPWLFSVNLFDPHHPFDPPTSYLQRYLDHLEDIPLPNYVPGELDNKPSFQKNDHRGGYNNRSLYPFDQMSDKDHRMVRAAYWAMCDLIDDQVGRLLAALRQSGQEENTIVVFMSDHGEMLGDHGIYLKGPFFYECATHVPLIISWPGQIAPGTRVHGMVELGDIAPTLLEAAGFSALPGMQARSLLPLLANGAQTADFRESVYCEYYNAMPWHHDPSAFATMVRTQDYKLVAIHGQNEGELYDLQSDAHETVNLWDHPDYQALKVEALKQLCDRMAYTVDPLPKRLAAW